jgi:site-specific recombinase XerD
MRRKPPSVPVAFELGGVVRSFLQEYELGPSTKTLAYYRDHVGRAFLTYMTAQGVTGLLAVTPDILRDWLAHEKASTYQRKGGIVRPLARSTLIQRKAAVNRFFEWCVDPQEYLPFNPMRKVARIKPVPAERVGFERLEATRLLREANRAPGSLGARDKAIVMLLLDTGCRASELLGLTAQSFEWPQRKVKLLGKGHKVRRVPLGPKASQAVRDYMRVRPESSWTNLFLTQRKTAMTYGALSAMLKHLGQYCTPPVPNVTAHRFRHTYASEWYREHHDILALRDLLGHSKVETTQQYLRTLGVDYGSNAGYTSPGEWLDG